MDTPRRIPLIAWVAPLVLLALGFGIGLHEWYVVAIEADPAQIARYAFGGEGPPAGAWNYENAEIYALSALALWMFCVLLATGFVAAGIRSSRRLLFSCYVSFGLLIAINYAL